MKNIFDRRKRGRKSFTFFNGTYTYKKSAKQVGATKSRIKTLTQENNLFLLITINSVLEHLLETLNMSRRQQIPVTFVAKQPTLDSLPIDYSLPIMEISSITFAFIGVLLLIKSVPSMMNKNDFNFRVVFLLAFLTNLVTVSLPGRFDGSTTPDIPWKTLFAPAGVYMW